MVGGCGFYGFLVWVFRVFCLFLWFCVGGVVLRWFWVIFSLFLLFLRVFLCLFYHSFRIFRHSILFSSFFNIFIPFLLIFSNLYRCFSVVFSVFSFLFGSIGGGSAAAISYFSDFQVFVLYFFVFLW